MKNYPNQASDFERLRATLQTVAELLVEGRDTTDDGVLGYGAAERLVYRFRYFDYDNGTEADLAERILLERQKDPGDQGARTFARELRRTFRDMDWMTESGQLTPSGRALLRTDPYSVEEQALLVEGLLNIQVGDRRGLNRHHPVRTMLRLLAISPTTDRRGLELALEPNNDSEAEFARVAAFYGLPEQEIIAGLGITKVQRDNAVKIFPSLAIAAGLVIKEGSLYSLSQDGLAAIEQTPNQAAVALNFRRGRRSTVGKVVNAETVASRIRRDPPRYLTETEQAEAAAKLLERTRGHQELVKRIALLANSEHGLLMEDEFSYDLFWLPYNERQPAVLFEMKTITTVTDAHARVRGALGQLAYYRYFKITPSFQDRPIELVAVFDAMIPDDLIGFMDFERVGGIVSTPAGEIAGINPRGDLALARLLEN